MPDRQSLTTSFTFGVLISFNVDFNFFSRCNIVVPGKKSHCFAFFKFIEICFADLQCFIFRMLRSCCHIPLTNSLYKSGEKLNSSAKTSLLMILCDGTMDFFSFLILLSICSILAIMET
jgi:hypothetical protein